MNPETLFAPRSAKRQPITLFSILLLVVLTVLGLGLGAAITGCTAQDTSAVVRTAEAIPQPSATVSLAIRGKVAAVVKAAVQKHPALAPYVNDLAKECYQLAGMPLPSPVLLKFLFGLASESAPAEIDDIAAPILQVYTQDQPAAAAIQGGSKAYLTALGQGIQDGVKAAGVSEAP